MRLFNTFSCFQKRPEASTDESMHTTSTGHKNRRPIVWWRNSKSQTKSALKKQNQLTKESKVLGSALQLEAGDAETDSELDIFQTLMSNSMAPSRTIAGGAHDSDKAPADIMASNNLTSISQSTMNPLFYHDPDFLPTAYPLTRSDPRQNPVARWGTLDLAASAALLEKPLKRFKQIQEKRPRFRLGPRNMEESDQEDSRGSGLSTTTGEVDSEMPKYAFISQDGKLVVRELYPWPIQKIPKLTQRYKMMEPYASNYGRAKLKYKKESKYPFLRNKYIYQTPIFRLPRSIMNETKQRLLARHMFKDSVDPTSQPFRLPHSVTVNYSEQCKKYMEFQMQKYTTEAIERIVYVEKLREIERKKHL